MRAIKNAKVKNPRIIERIPKKFTSRELEERL